MFAKNASYFGCAGVGVLDQPLQLGGNAVGQIIDPAIALKLANSGKGGFRLDRNFGDGNRGC